MDVISDGTQGIFPQSAVWDSQDFLREKYQVRVIFILANEVQ